MEKDMEMGIGLLELIIVAGLVLVPIAVIISVVVIFANKKRDE